MTSPLIPPHQDSKDPKFHLKGDGGGGISQQLKALWATRMLLFIKLAATTKIAYEQ